jgi:hypothetical protein
MSIEISSEEYISKLQSVIESSYKCRATYRRTIATRASRDPNWPARVEMFWLTGHATAKRCFAWIDPVTPSQIFAVLEIPPVIGAATAVQAALASRSQQTGRQDKNRQCAIG